MARHAAGRGAENRGLDLQIHGLGIALAGCLIALAASWVVPALALFILVPLAACFAYARRIYNRSDTWLRGARGEQAVGRELDGLEAAGWQVRHDVMKPSGGNVDHVVAGPGGIFAIETKLHRFGKAGIRQAHSHARYLRKTLGVEVLPVICLANRHSAPKEYAAVWCMGVPHLTAFLEAQQLDPAAPGTLDCL